MKKMNIEIPDSVLLNPEAFNPHKLTVEEMRRRSMGFYPREEDLKKEIIVEKKNENKTPYVTEEVDEEEYIYDEYDDFNDDIEDEEEYVSEMNECISFRKSALELNRELFRTIFHRGNFFNIEIFKQIIRLGIRNNGIDKIIFKRMPYKFTVDEYKNYLSGIHSDYEIFEYAKTYTVVISCHGKTICVAMWDHSLPYF